jgi:Ran GTPase-activating protein (RanGAP) involved in mRNA processing and transport
MFEFFTSLFENDPLRTYSHTSNGYTHNDDDDENEYDRLRKMRYQKSSNHLRHGNNRCFVPLHPFQTFSHLCDRIERNDPSLTVVEFRDEFINVRRLACAIATNYIIVELNLIQSIRDRETRDSRPRSAPAHDVLHLCMEGLRHNVSIEKLDLTETSVRASGASFLSRGLRCHPKIRKLCLRRCLLQDEGLRRLSAASMGEKLEELDLSSNNLSDGTALMQLLVRNPNLKILDVSNNSLCSKGMDEFVSCGGFHSLESCDMSCNNIQRDTKQSLGNALADQNCHLKVLCLDVNYLMDCAMESIALGLVSNTSLEKLSLKGNSVEDVGACKIAVAIGNNPSIRIQELLLAGNKIRNAGAVSLMQYSTKSMVKLDLSRNRISDGRSICKVLRTENMFMRRLSLARNLISPQHIHEIEFWTKLNNSGGRQLLGIAGGNIDGGHSLGIWPKILGRLSSQPTGLYFFLIRKPELCQRAAGVITNKKTQNIHRDDTIS